MKRRLEGPSCTRHPGRVETVVGERLRGGERGEVPRELVGGVVLDVGHGVCDRASMKRVAILTDLGPSGFERRAGKLRVAVLAGGEAAAEALHDLVRSAHAPSVSAAFGFARRASGNVCGIGGVPPDPAFRGQAVCSSAGSVMDV